MSLETFSSRPEEAATPRAFSAPPAQPPAPDLPPTVVSPPSTLTETLQARRLRVARELEQRIARLEQELATQAASLQQTGSNIRLSLRELQQRSSSLTTELLRTGARLARLGRDQQAAQRELEGRLEESLRPIDAAMATLGSQLHQQQRQCQELKERQDTLSRLQHHLDRIVHRQGRQQDLFTAEFGQRLKLLSLTLETQQDFANQQHTGLLGLTLQHEQLTLDLQRLHHCLDNFSQRLEQRLQRLRHRQQLLASLLAALAILSLVLIAWCQTHPVTLPPKAKQQLATLSSDLQQQDLQGQAQARTLSAHEERLADLQAALAQARDHNRRLRQATRRHERELREVATRLASLQQDARHVTPIRTATASH